MLRICLLNRFPNALSVYRRACLSNSKDSYESNIALWLETCQVMDLSNHNTLQERAQNENAMELFILLSILRPEAIAFARPNQDRSQGSWMMHIP